MSKRGATKCPTPTKVAYTREAIAVGAAKAIQHDSGDPMDTYKCKCGRYHLTSDIGVSKLAKSGRKR